jgi:competence protein ComEC
MTAGVRRLWAKRPLFFVAAGVVTAIGLSALDARLGWGGCIALGCFAWFAGGRGCGILAMAVAAVLIAEGRRMDARQAENEAAVAKAGYCNATARLIEDAENHEGAWSAVARLRGGEFDGMKVRWIGTGDPAPTGTELRAEGVFSGIGKERNPGVPDRGQRLRDEGVVGVFKANGMRSTQWIGPVSQWGAGVKHEFRKSLVAGLDEESMPAKVILAVVLGERAKDSLGLVKDFRESGTLHVFSVSGMHVMMLGGMIWFALKWLGVPRRAAIPVIILAMFGYVWLTGNGPAALRAAWMAAVFLGGFALRRRTDLLNALGAVLLASLLFDPHLIRMLGVQLSYGVVAAIGLGSSAARRCFAWMAEKETFLPDSEVGFLARKWLGFRRGAADSCAASTAASVGSAPLTAFHFGLVTPVSVIATVALVPMVFALMSIALMSAMLHPFWERGAVFLNCGNAYVARACAHTAGIFADLPGASASIRTPESPTLVIHDLGYGASSACFASGAGNAVLLDTGGKFSLEREVGPSLMGLGFNPDSAILTHTDSGHVAPPELVLEMFPLRQIASGMVSVKGSAAEKWAGSGADMIRITQPARGDRLDFGGGAWAEILLSPSGGSPDSLADDNGLVFRLHWQERTILFTGDAGRIGEQALLDSGSDLRSDVIVAGLHESDLSLTKAFVAAVRPQAIVIPRDAGSEMDWHRAFQKKAWLKNGIQVIDQTDAGGLTVTIGSEGQLLIQGFFDGSETRVPTR